MAKGDPGRPEYTDDQYKTWLEEMRPHLVLGCSLWRAIEKTGLITHTTTIYEKYRLKDWFSQKVDTYRMTPGENANEAIVRLVNAINDKVKRDESLTREDIDILKHFTDKHRTAQPFFVTRTETAQADDSKIGKILDDLERTDYGELGQEATKQMVAVDTPIQDQG
jgi:hypothetical protein